MTINEAIEQLDRLKPNAYETAEKVRWLSELDGQITDELLTRIRGGAAPFEGYSESEDLDTELIAEDRYADLYIKYLCAQVDYHNGEWTRYNNSAALFTAAYEAYAAYLRRSRPVEPGPKIVI